MKNTEEDHNTMEEDLPESSLDDVLQCSNGEDMHSIQDLNLYRHQDRQITKLDFLSRRDQDQAQVPPPDLLEGQRADQNPAGCSRASVEDLSQTQQSQGWNQVQGQR